MPLPGIDLKLVDPEGNEVADHEVGEILFRGPNMMKGYYKSDETANTMGTAGCIQGIWRTAMKKAITLS